MQYIFLLLVLFYDLLSLDLVDNYQDISTCHLEKNVNLQTDFLSQYRKRLNKKESEPGYEKIKSIFSLYLQKLYRNSFLENYLKCGRCGFLKTLDTQMHDLLLLDDVHQEDLFDKQTIISQKACCSDKDSITYECVFCHKKSFAVCFWEKKKYWNHKIRQNRVVIYKALTNILYVKVDSFTHSKTINPSMYCCRNCDVIGYIEGIETCDTLLENRTQKQHKKQKKQSNIFRGDDFED